MVEEPPSLHAVPSQGRGALTENFRIFKAPGCILGYFWSIWLSTSVPLNKAFVA